MLQDGYKEKRLIIKKSTNVNTTPKPQHSTGAMKKQKSAFNHVNLQTKQQNGTL